MQDAQQKAYFLGRAEEERAAADNGVGRARGQVSPIACSPRYDAKAKGSPVREISGKDATRKPTPKDFQILPIGHKADLSTAAALWLAARRR